VNLEPVADELYWLPREEFTAARNAAAGRAHAHAHGHRDLAEQIGALRRPSTAVWLPTGWRVSIRSRSGPCGSSVMSCADCHSSVTS
jgi:hypothetical protein